MVVVQPGGGEVIGDAPDRRVEIVADDAVLNATWSRFGPGRDGADLHVHRRHHDCFYVLEGELTLRLGLEGREVALPAGTLARIPPLVVHGFRNGSRDEVRYLNLHAPGEFFADYLRAMRDGRDFAYDQEAPPGDGGRPPEDAEMGPLGAAVAAGPIAVAERRLAAGEALGADARYAYVLEGELALGDQAAPPGAWLAPAAGAEARGDARVLVVSGAMSSPGGAGLGE